MSPTVGRVDALDEIDGLLARLASGSAGLLVLRGEAGIGKSHLCQVAVTRAAAAGIRTAVGFADELEQDRPGQLLLRVESELATADLEPVAPPELRPPDDGDPGYRSIERFLTAVGRAAAARPLLLVAEDLHWADDLSLRGLATFIRGLEQVPCALLTTERSHPRPRRLVDVEAAVARVVDGVHRRSVDLVGLSSVEVEQLAAQRLGAMPGTRLRSVLAGAAGNPFMVHALLQAASLEGILRVGGGVAEIPTGTIPSAAHDVLVHHLRTLSPATVELLRHASLLGRHFTATELAVITGEPVVDVVRRLGDAVAAGIVVFAEEHHEFHHDLVRDAVHRSLDPAARRDLHRAAGAALAKGGAPPLRVAQQLAAGARPGDIEAVEWMRRAAADALALDTGTAAERLERALSLAPAGWSCRFETRGRPRRAPCLGRADRTCVGARPVTRRPGGPGQREVPCAPGARHRAQLDG